MLIWNRVHALCIYKSQKRKSNAPSARAEERQQDDIDEVIPAEDW